MGITNMMATFPGFIVPAMVGIMTEGNPGLAPWHQIFYITSGILLVEALIFGIFAQTDEQPWNRVQKETDYELQEGQKPAAGDKLLEEKSQENPE